MLGIDSRTIRKMRTGLIMFELSVDPVTLWLTIILFIIIIGLVLVGLAISLNMFNRS